MRQMLRDLIAYLPTRVVPGALGLALVAILTRLFPPHEYADWALFQTVNALFLTVSIAWLGSSAARFLPAAKSEKEAARLARLLARWGAAAVLATLALLAAAFWAAGPRLPATFRALAPVAAPALVCVAITELILALLRGRREVGRYTALSLWSTIGAFAVGLGLVAGWGLRVEAMIWGLLAAAVTAAPWGLRRALGAPPGAGAVPAETAVEIVRYGLPALVINVLTWALSVSDRYLLELMRGPHEMGVYAAAYSLAERPIFFINSAFLVATTPLGFAVWEQEGLQRSREYLAQLTRTYLLVGLPAAVGLGVLAVPLTAVLVGAQFREGADIIAPVAAGALLVGLAQRYTLPFGFHKRTGALMACYLAAAALNVALNVAAIPRWGYRGAAFTTLAGYAALLAATWFASRRFYTWAFPFATFARAAAGAAVMGAGVWALVRWAPLPSWALLAGGVAGGAACYGAVLLALGEFRARART